MRVPYTKEMVEMDKKIQPYLVMDGIVCVLSPDAPDEIKELEKKFRALFDEQRQLCMAN